MLTVLGVQFEMYSRYQDLLLLGCKVSLAFLFMGHIEVVHFDFYELMYLQEDHWYITSLQTIYAQGTMLLPICQASLRTSLHKIRIIASKLLKLFHWFELFKHVNNTLFITFSWKHFQQLDAFLPRGSKTSIKHLFA